MRKSPSDEWRWRPSHERWSYYRWLSWSLCAVGLLMALFTGVWFFTEFVRLPSSWDRDTLTFLGPFSIGSAAISFVGWRAYGWLGRREPPAPE